MNTLSKQIYLAADRANAALANNDDAAWEKHNAEVIRLTTLRLQELRTGVSAQAAYPPVQFRREPDEEMLK